MLPLPPSQASRACQPGRHERQVALHEELEGLVRDERSARRPSPLRCAAACGTSRYPPAGSCCACVDRPRVDLSGLSARRTRRAHTAHHAEVPALVCDGRLGLGSLGAVSACFSPSRAQVRTARATGGNATSSGATTYERRKVVVFLNVPRSVLHLYSTSCPCVCMLHPACALRLHKVCKAL